MTSGQLTVITVVWFRALCHQLLFVCTRDGCRVHHNRETCRDLVHNADAEFLRYLLLRHLPLHLTKHSIKILSLRSIHRLLLSLDGRRLALQRNLACPPLDQDTDSEEPSSSCVLSGWLVLGVATQLAHPQSCQRPGPVGPKRFSALQKRRLSNTDTSDCSAATASGHITAAVCSCEVLSHTDGPAKPSAGVIHVTSALLSAGLLSHADWSDSATIQASVPPV